MLVRYRDDLATEIDTFVEKMMDNEMKYKYWNITNDTFVRLDTIETGNEIIRFSVAEGKLLGYFHATIEPNAYYINNLSVLCANLDTISFTFVKDLEKFMSYLLDERRFNKLVFEVVVGNPAERLYDAFIARNGGRIVGYYKNHYRLLDNRLYDCKLYEVINS